MSWAEITAADLDLAALRARGVRWVSLIFWLLSAGFVIIAINAYVSAVARWLELVDRSRGTLGFVRPGAGPDWLLVAAVALALAAPALVAALFYTRYRAYWSKRLLAAWPERRDRRRHRRILRLDESAPSPQVTRRVDYMRALAQSPAWSGHVDPADAAVGETDEAAYRTWAEGVLAQVEEDVCRRALATGLIVGMSRNRFIDAFTIASAAFELQLHVLARLGKKPGPRTWAELWKRTAASLFLNTYATRDEAWGLAFAVKKAAMGLEVAAEAGSQVADWMASLDPGEYLDALPDEGVTRLLKSGTELMLSSTSLAVGIGASGVHQISVLIDRYGEDILEGVLAGGILYYHGMAIAADCLALDQRHRATPAMNRTFRQAAGRISAAAGGLVRKQVQDYRAALAERRKFVAAQMVEKARQAPGKALNAVWDRVRGLGQPSPPGEGAG